MSNATSRAVAMLTEFQHSVLPRRRAAGQEGCPTIMKPVELEKTLLRKVGAAIHRYLMIRQGYRVGQLVAIADHINLMGWNPLVGPNESRFAFRDGAGLRFTDMTEAYSKALRTLAKEAAGE